MKKCPECGQPLGVLDDYTATPPAKHLACRACGYTKYIGPAPAIEDHSTQGPSWRNESNGRAWSPEQGKALRTLRQQRGISSQTKLAIEVGLTYPTIMNLENGNVSVLRGRTAAALTRFFGEPFARILVGRP